VENRTVLSLRDGAAPPPEDHFLNSPSFNEKEEAHSQESSNHLDWSVEDISQLSTVERFRRTQRPSLLERRRVAAAASPAKAALHSLLKGDESTTHLGEWNGVRNQLLETGVNEAENGGRILLSLSTQIIREP